MFDWPGLYDFPFFHPESQLGQGFTSKHIASPPPPPILPSFLTCTPLIHQYKLKIPHHCVEEGGGEACLGAATYIGVQL